MSIMNYFLIGTFFTFIMDYLLDKGLNKYPKLIKETWGMKERIINIIIWPLSLSVFVIGFLKLILKK